MDNLSISFLIVKSVKKKTDSNSKQNTYGGWNFYQTYKTDKIINIFL